MKTTLLLLLVSLMYTFPSSEDLLRKHRWKDRVLLVFSPAQSDSLHQKQMKLFQQQAEGLSDRNLVIYEVFPTSGTYQQSTTLSPSEVNGLRKSFLVSPTKLTIILVGKDGGEKARTVNQIFSIPSLFSLIDAMPMRRQEMKRKKDQP